MDRGCLLRQAERLVEQLLERVPPSHSDVAMPRATELVMHPDSD